MQLPISPKIALLIDADNASADLVDEILTELSTLGVINIRRAYGNWTKSALNGWQARLLDFAIRPMQQFDYSRRKNATDMAMTVDAMELLYTERPDVFGIVSSDADFTPLVLHLRSKGAMVVGFGAAQTPRPFVNACSRFLYLEALRERAEQARLQQPAPSDDTPPVRRGLRSGSASASRKARKPAGTGDAVDSATAPEHAGADTQEQQLAHAALRVARNPGQRVPTEELRSNRRLMERLQRVVRATADEQGWASVGRIGEQIGNVESFDPRNFGYGSLTRLLKATEAFEFRDEGTPAVAVRWRG